MTCVITRDNDRRLRTSATDWVKNGDRWTVQNATTTDGSLRVRHTRTGRTLTLPAGYVAASVELGYATTVHGAQGVSVDTMHGLATGAESRQQLYTMLTRGRLTNHVHLQVVGDGDPHTVIRPENLHPDTATDLLEQVLARDDSPVSATTMLRDQADPATRLADAAARYADALHVAAEHHLGPHALAALDAGADRIVDDLTEDPAWPTLRAHLILLAAHGGDPLACLTAAAAGRELDTAGDRAAVLDWRLDDPNPTHHHCRSRRGRPAAVAARHPRRPAHRPDLGHLPGGASGPGHRPRRPGPRPRPHHRRAGVGPARTGPTRPGPARRRRRVACRDRRPRHRPPTHRTPSSRSRRSPCTNASLEARLTGGRSPALAEWGHLLHQVAPAVRGDEFTPVLAERLAAISRAGIDAHHLLRAAAAASRPARRPRRRRAVVADQPPPHPRRRHQRRRPAHPHPHLDHPPQPGCSGPSVHETCRTARAGRPWSPPSTTPSPAATASTRSPPWPALLDPAVDVDPCQALVWRLSVLTDPPPALHDDDRARRAGRRPRRGVSAGRGGRLVATRRRHRPGGPRPD